MTSNRWIIFLPGCLLIYALACLDRLNFGFGVAAGLGRDLHISQGQLALLSALSFLGYFIFQVPMALLAQRVSEERILMFCSIGWGALTIITGLLTDVRLLYLDRFMLGVSESPVIPCLMLMLEKRFSSSERARAISVLLLGGMIALAFMSVASGYLADLWGWRVMFVVEGVPSVVWAFCWPTLFSKANLVQAHQSILISKETAASDSTRCEINKLFKMLHSPHLLIGSGLFFWWSLQGYGFTTWSPSILGFTGMRLIAVGWISAGMYGLAMIVKLLAAAISDKLKIRKKVIWPFFLLGMVAFLVPNIFPSGSLFQISVLFLMGGISANGPAGVLFAYITDATEPRSVGLAFSVLNSIGALGSFVGSYVLGLFAGSGSDLAYFYWAMSTFSVLALLFALLLPRENRKAEDELHSDASLQAET